MRLWLLILLANCTPKPARPTTPDFCAWITNGHVVEAGQLAYRSVSADADLVPWLRHQACVRAIGVPQEGKQYGIELQPNAAHDVLLCMGTLTRTSFTIDPCRVTRREPRDVEMAALH